MDILFFLKERITFIRYYYNSASIIFNETKKNIESGEPPFDDCRADDYPPYEVEWHNADMGLDFLGRTCVSMLSASLRLYFETWEKQFNIQWKEGEKNKAFKSGFVDGYRKCFGEALRIPWDKCPVDFSLIEQIILARNSDQHPVKITSIRTHHAQKDIRKHRLPFFMSDFDRTMLSDSTLPDWMAPAINVSRDTLFEAIIQVELLGDWLEGQMMAAKYQHSC